MMQNKDIVYQKKEIMKKQQKKKKIQHGMKIMMISMNIIQIQDILVMELQEQKQILQVEMVEKKSVTISGM